MLFNKKVVPTLESLFEIFALSKEDVLHPTSFKSITRFQQKDKSLNGIAKEKPNGADKTYSLIFRHEKILISN